MRRPPTAISRDAVAFADAALDLIYSVAAFVFFGIASGIQFALPTGFVSYASLFAPVFHIFTTCNAIESAAAERRRLTNSSDSERAALNARLAKRAPRRLALGFFVVASASVIGMLTTASKRLGG